MEESRIDPTIAYDVVELPSKGIHYPGKRKSLRIAYLTAADENILSSPNLLAQSTVIVELLKRKVLDREIPVEEIVQEDREAILIFLRNTAFGTEYNMSVTDPKTKEPFQTVIDLSVIKIKDFTLEWEDNMHRFLLVFLISVTVVFFACAAEREEPAPTEEPSVETTITEEPALTPADTVTGSVTTPAGVNVPGVVTGEAVGAMTPDGASTTFVDNRFLSDYIRAIIMNDMEYLEKFSI